jgi:hypothetical protein
MLGVRRELDTAILSSYSEASLGCRAFGRFLAIILLTFYKHFTRSLGLEIMRLTCLYIEVRHLFFNLYIEIMYHIKMKKNIYLIC